MNGLKEKKKLLSGLPYLVPVHLSYGGNINLIRERPLWLSG